MNVPRMNEFTKWTLNLGITAATLYGFIDHRLDDLEKKLVQIQATLEAKKLITADDKL